MCLSFPPHCRSSLTAHILVYVVPPHILHFRAFCLQPACRSPLRFRSRVSAKALRFCSVCSVFTVDSRDPNSCQVPLPFPNLGQCRSPHKFNFLVLAACRSPGAGLQILSERFFERIFKKVFSQNFSAGQDRNDFSCKNL